MGALESSDERNYEVTDIVKSKKGKDRLKENYNEVKEKACSKNNEVEARIKPNNQKGKVILDGKDQVSEAIKKKFENLSKKEIISEIKAIREQKKLKSETISKCSGVYSERYQLSEQSKISERNLNILKDKQAVQQISNPRNEYYKQANKPKVMTELRKLGVKYRIKNCFSDANSDKNRVYELNQKCNNDKKGNNRKQRK